MLCNICNKKTATVHLTEIIDNQVNELHLCEECAKQKGAQMEQEFGLADLLAGLADLGVPVESSSDAKLKCSNCGMQYKDFKKIGRLGCGVCYDTFAKSLTILLKRIHGSTHHLGKVPLKLLGQKPQMPQTKASTKSELQDLKSKLQKAIQLEEFEEAARLRDLIKDAEDAAGKNKPNKNK